MASENGQERPDVLVQRVDGRVDLERSRFGVRRTGGTPRFAPICCAFKGVASDLSRTPRKRARAHKFAFLKSTSVSARTPQPAPALTHRPPGSDPYLYLLPRNRLAPWSCAAARGASAAGPRRQSGLMHVWSGFVRIMEVRGWVVSSHQPSRYRAEQTHCPRRQTRLASAGKPPATRQDLYALGYSYWQMF